MVHIAALELSTAMLIHPSKTLQVLDNPTLAALQENKALTEFPAKYSDYPDVFSPELAMELLEHMGMNQYVIKLIDGKQSPYMLIYTLSPVELETLKTYIETQLKTGFIQLSKFLAGTLIFFDKKPDGSLCLYMDY